MVAVEEVEAVVFEVEEEVILVEEIIVEVVVIFEVEEEWIEAAEVDLGKIYNLSFSLLNLKLCKEKKLCYFRGGSGRGGPGGRGFGDRGNRGSGRGGGGPSKRGGGPPGSSGPSKRPRFDQPSSQPANGYATQPPRYLVVLINLNRFHVIKIKNFIIKKFMI